MKERIDAMYSCQKHYAFRAGMTAILSLTLFIIFLSLFLGSPIGYSTQTAEGTVVHEGWLFSKWYLMVLFVLIMGFFLGQRNKRRIFHDVSLLDNMLLVQCEALAHMEAYEYAVTAGKALPMKGQVRNLFSLIEPNYIMALVANRRYERADKYIQAGWTAKGDGAHRIAETSLELAKAYSHNNAQKYRQTLEKAPDAFRRNPLYSAELLILEGRYAEAVERLGTKPLTLRSSEVDRRFRLGEAYAAMGETEKARVEMEFVVSEAKTMPCHRDAQSWLDTGVLSETIPTEKSFQAEKLPAEPAAEAAGSAESAGAMDVIAAPAEETTDAVSE